MYHRTTLAGLRCSGVLHSGGRPRKQLLWYPPLSAARGVSFNPDFLCICMFNLFLHIGQVVESVGLERLEMFNLLAYHVTKTS
jgi:hypothetical protein